MKYRHDTRLTVEPPSFPTSSARTRWVEAEDRHGDDFSAHITIWYAHILLIITNVRSDHIPAGYESGYISVPPSSAAAELSLTLKSPLSNPTIPQKGSCT